MVHRMKSNRSIVLFLLSQAVTLFGSSIVQYAISWHITLTTKSGSMLTISILCGFLPQVLISLFAGVWADRFSRKKIILFADGLIACFTAILAVLFWLGHDSLVLLFAISAIRSVGAGLQTPAVSAMLPDLVPPDKLMQVNGVNASIQSVMFLLSPAIAGFLYGALPLGLIFWVDVITAAIGMTILSMLRTDQRKADATEPMLADMLRGFRYVWKKKWLRQLLLFFYIFSMMFGPVVFLTPLMVARSFGDEPWRLVVHETVFSIGSVLGGLLVSLLASKIKNKMHLLLASSLFFGLTTFLMGLSRSFLFYLCIMFPMGVTMPAFNTSAMTIFQTRVQPELLGRVFSLVSIIMSSTMPLSMAIFGPLADRVSVERLLIITGLAMVVISLATACLRDLCAAGRPPSSGAPKGT